MNVTTAQQGGFTVFSQEEFKNPQSENKLRQSFKDGFFYLEMPEACKKVFSAGVDFANSFHKSEQIKAKNLSGFGGYHDRQDSDLQIESHYAERSDWEVLHKEGIYSDKQVELAKCMHQIGLDILRKALTLLDVPEKEWDKLTGKLTQGEGTVHFSVNNYRSKIQHPGLPPHKDIGFVTVLFINQAGLEAEHQGEWKPISPLKEHFIVNFGGNLEIATGKRDLVKAAWHRVQQVAQDRISFGVFIDGDLKEPVYSYDGTSCTQKYPTTKEYVAEAFKEVYKS